MYDGIVSQEEWNLAPKHILFILKDYNEKGKRKSFWFDLRSYLRQSISEPDKWRTWDNVARWTFGLLHSEYGKYPSFSEANRQGLSTPIIVFFSSLNVYQ